MLRFQSPLKSTIILLEFYYR